MAISLVIIDDNAGSLELLSIALAQEGLEILTASDPEEGLDLVFNKHPQIVITDLVMPKMSGMEILEKVVDFDPAIEVILITAHYSTESAVEAIRKGAADYLNKPVSIDDLRNRIAKLLDDLRRQQQTVALEDQMLMSARFEGIIGRSPRIWEMFSRIRRVAPHFRTVLITGETGTGKDRAIHPRAKAARLGEHDFPQSGFHHKTPISCTSNVTGRPASGWLKSNTSASPSTSRTTPA